MFTSVVQAIKTLDDLDSAVGAREAALRYLAERPTPAIIARIVQALQDDDFGVRWEAANVVTQLGEPALLEVVKALTDPQRVGDPRLREIAYHILHSQQLALPVPITDLLAALKGPAADIASLIEADHVLNAIEKYRIAQLAAQLRNNESEPANLRSWQYGRARLAGRLSHLTGHRF